MNSASPGTNYGTSGNLVIDGSPVDRGYLRFDLRGLQGDVTQAMLSLHALKDSGALDLRGVADTSWRESTVTYNNAPAIGPS